MEDKKKQAKVISRRDFVKYCSATATGLAITGFPALVRSQKKPEEILVGMAHPLTGAGALGGQEYYRAAMMMVDIINADGGIKALGSAKLRVIFKDTETKLEVSVANTERFCQDPKISLVTGCMVSSFTLVTSQIAEKYKVPYINEGALSERINQRGLKYTFTTRPTSPNYARSFIAFIEDLAKKTDNPPKKIALLNEDSEAGQTIGNNLKAEVVKSPLKLKIVEDILYPMSAMDLSSVIMKLKAAKPDIVAGFHYMGDSMLLQRQMKQLKFDCMGRFTVSGWEPLPSYTKTLGNDANYILNTSTAYPNMRGIPGLENIALKYEQLYGGPASNVTFLMCLAMGVIRKSLESVKSIDREEIREAIAKVEIAPGEFGNYGIAPVKFDSNGKNIGTRPVVGQIQNQKMICVWPEQYAVSKLILPVPKWSDRT